MKAIVVDDERLARSELKRLLAAVPEVTVVGEAANPAEARTRIAALRPDLVFLDIQMPGFDGFSVVQGLMEVEPPLFVFVTAYSDHAIRAFEAQARALLARGAATLLLFDIDHFKKINDSFGHNVGDFVLQDFAFQMQTSLRRDNPIGRLGGEEFVVILPELGSAQVHTIICRLVNKIREKGNSPNNICPSYTVSVGIAKYDGNEEIDAFLARADTALYQAKRSGRDQICTV